MGEEKKLEFKTAVYKVNVHCGQCARDIETQFTEFHGVQEVKLDAGAGKVTVKGVGFDVEKLRVKAEKGCRRRIEFIPPPEDIVTEVKVKEEELTIITVSVPLHCPECAVRVKEILLEHKSIYAASVHLGKNQCVVEGVIEEAKLTEYIYHRTRKHCTIVKVEKTVRIVEEKVEVKKTKVEKVEEVVEEVVEAVVEEVKELKEVVAPYFIPCTHPHFIDYSHPRHRGFSPCGGGDYGYGGGGGGFSPYGGGYGFDSGDGYPPYGGDWGHPSYTHSELKGYQETSFLHCTHPVGFLSHEDPNACSVM